MRRKVVERELAYLALAEQPEGNQRRDVDYDRTNYQLPWRDGELQR